MHNHTMADHGLGRQATTVTLSQYGYLQITTIFINYETESGSKELSLPRNRKV